MESSQSLPSIYPSPFPFPSLSLSLSPSPSLSLSPPPTSLSPPPLPLPPLSHLSPPLSPSCSTQSQLYSTIILLPSCSVTPTQEASSIVYDVPLHEIPKVPVIKLPKVVTPSETAETGNVPNPALGSDDQKGNRSKRHRPSSMMSLHHHRVHKGKDKREKSEEREEGEREEGRKEERIEQDHAIPAIRCSRACVCLCVFVNSLNFSENSSYLILTSRRRATTQY